MKIIRATDGPTAKQFLISLLDISYRTLLVGSSNFV